MSLKRINDDTSSVLCAIYRIFINHERKSDIPYIIIDSISLKISKSILFRASDISFVNNHDEKMVVVQEVYSEVNF